MKIPLTENILNQLMINKYSGFNTIFVNDIEYKVIGRIDNSIKVKL